MTGNNACTATYPATLGNTVAKDGVEYASVKAIEITPVLKAGIGGYKNEDTITLDLTGAKINLTETTAPTITATAGGIVDPADITQASANGVADISFDVLDVSATQVRFTVNQTGTDPAAVAPNAILSVSGVFLDSTGLSSSSTVSLASFATNTSGTDFDPAAATNLITLVPQYSVTMGTLYDALIDVAQDRQTFENTNEDELTFEIKKQTTGLELTPASVKYVVGGDFSWFNNKAVDANEDGKLSSAEIASAVTASYGTSFSVNSALNELTITGATGTPVGTQSIKFTVPGYDDGDLDNPIIPVQSFDLAVDVLDDKSFSAAAVTMQALAATYAGAWELNGSVIYLPYVPFGPNTQPIIRHTNKGTRTGDITVRYMVEGEHTEWQDLSAADVADATPGVRNMLSLVNDALVDEGYDSSVAGFKVALEFVTNVPARDVFVYGGAKVTAEGQDRIHLGTLKDND
jgi:hypothetical protein